MKVIRIIFSIILSFILMLGILATSVLNIANKYTTKDHLIAKFDEIDLYTQVYEEVRAGFEEYIYQSGLDVEILDKICNREKVKQDLLLVVDAMYGGGKVNIDTSEIKTNLSSEINKFVEAQNRKLSKQEEENITKFEKLIVSSYENELSIYKKLQEQLPDSFNDDIKIITKIRNVCMIVTCVVGVLLLLINIKKIYSGISYIGVALFSSGILFVLTEKLINTSVNIDDIIILSKAMSNALIYIVKELLSAIGTYGVWYIVIGVIVIILTAIKNKI